MERTNPVACWHHGDKEQLYKNLDREFIDLYGENELTEKGTNRQSYLLGYMKLQPGDRIRIRVGRDIVAYATIVDGKTFELDDNTKCERGRPWKAGMKVKCIQKVEQRASCSPNFQRSHRFDTKKASQLSR